MIKIGEIKLNKKLIASILLAGTMALSTQGCSRFAGVVDEVKSIKLKTPTTMATPEVTVEPTARPTQYIDKRNQVIDLNVINFGYEQLEENDYYTLYTGSTIYYKPSWEWTVTSEEITDQLLRVRGIAKNDTFTCVELPNGETAFVYNGSLIKCANIHNAEYTTVGYDRDGVIKCDSYLYDASGMYMGYLYEGQTCYKFSTNGEYTAINLPDGRIGYVLASSLENMYQQIDGAAFIKAGTPLYLNKGLTEFYRNANDEMVYVEYLTSEYAAIFDESGQNLLYMNPAGLDDDFILVDISDQKMDCYIDYHVAGSWGTRTGKDASPTHTGAYDIDAKVPNWEFTTFPGSYAKYWIPIDTGTQEGIHDLVGDDEWNYGTEAYHTNGSHGCIRVPVEASEFVYENYDTGDMVYVRK